MEAHIKCQNCDEDKRAISRCMDCNNFLCQECQKAHERMTFMKSHKIYTLTQLRSGEIVYKSKLREEVPKCCKHPDQNLNVYCNSCEQVICTTCSVLDHAKHSLTGLPEAVEKCKKKVTEMVQKSESRTKELGTTIEETCKSQKELETMFAKTQKKISKKAQQEITKLQQEITKLKHEVAKIQEEITKVQKEEKKLLKETGMIYKDKLKAFEAVQATNRKEVTQTEHKLEEVKQLCLIYTIYGNRSLLCPEDQRLVCVDYYGANVFSVDMTSNMQEVGHPTGVCCDNDGSIYVAVHKKGIYPTGAILHYSPDGKYIECAIKDCGLPNGITFTSDMTDPISTNLSRSGEHHVSHLGVADHAVLVLLEGVLVSEPQELELSSSLSGTWA
ncbi:E3 ubiquitin-protein ligase TRIM71-like [Patiria miniata]|uniref:B box-type domain-containing protein n=1 Tax=Patiria miniata TaxID=46514 RepID=A0A913ZT82_PATMI|nr:E3 ubiquitin-protein ligase TRIM71-like [Patiria miniata]